MEPYRPRPIRYHGLRDVDGWRLKVYTIVHSGTAALTEYEDAWPLLAGALPRPAVAKGRPGVGFVILHRGRGVHYAEVAWWDRENELPIRVFVRAIEPGATWRPAEGSESVCVWDLEVIGFERDVYVRTALADSGPDVDQYLLRVAGD